jgi:ketosteroid isomerase-like protein
VPRSVGEVGVAELVERFYAAFNAEDLDAFAAVLHPHVELQTARGLREGRDEARRWATRNPAGGLEQRIVLEEVREGDRGAHALALIRKQWSWRETEEIAHDQPEAALFTFRDGLVARWQPFADRGEALALFAERR